MDLISENWKNDEYRSVDNGWGIIKNKTMERRHLDSLGLSGFTGTHGYR